MRCTNLKAMAIIFLHIMYSAETTFTATSGDYASLVNAYANSGKSLTSLPPKNDDTALSVDVKMEMSSMNAFDAVAGRIEIAGNLVVTWTDETKIIHSAKTTLTSGTLVFPPYLVWTPSLVLLNAVDTVEDVGDDTYMVRYDLSGGACEWRPRAIISAACTPDVTYYPFDRQSCSVIYSAWDYFSTEVVLTNSESAWGLSNYEENGLWKIVSTSSEVGTSSENNSLITFKIEIERQPLYFTFNVVLPILLLGLLNGFVFLLPSDSGERMGFCITCFLAFMVLLQTVNQFMPQVASPMSLLCYYVVIMMLFSTFITIATIFTLRIHFTPKDKEPPRVLQFIAATIKCTVCGLYWRRRKVENAMELKESRGIDSNARVAYNSVRLPRTRLNGNNEGSPNTGEGKLNYNIDWPDIARILDLFFFLGFIAVQSVFSLLYLVPVGNRA